MKKITVTLFAGGIKVESEDDYTTALEQAQATILYQSILAATSHIEKQSARGGQLDPTQFRAALSRGLLQSFPEPEDPQQ